MFSLNDCPANTVTIHRDPLADKRLYSHSNQWRKLEQKQKKEREIQKISFSSQASDP